MSIRRALAVVRGRPATTGLAALVAGLLAGPWAPGAVPVLAAVGLAVAGRRRGVLAAGLVAAVLAGALVGQARLAALDAPAAGVRSGAAVADDAVLLEPPRAWPSGPVVALARVDGRRLLVRAPPGVPWPAGTTTGDVVGVRGVLRRLGARDGWLRVRGAHGWLVAARIVATGRRRGGVAGAVDGVRRRAEAALTRRVPAAPAALLRGMALGQDGALPDDLRDDVRAAGLAHLVAASGQNVALLAALALGLCALVGLPLRARLVLVLGLVALYVPLAGGGPSIQRAGVMGVATVAAVLAGRPALRWHVLLLAAAATLALQPRAPADAGWQLSFAAVLGILALAPRLRAGLRRRGVPGAPAEATAVTVAATLATAPLMALHFGSTSLVGLPANVLAAPLVAPATWLALVAAALGQPAPAAAAPVAALAAVPAAALELLAHAAARVPHAQAHAPAALVAAACAAAALGILVRRLRTPLAAATALGTALVVALQPAPARPPAGARVSVLDVGQGDATLLQDGPRAILVDTGPPHGPVLRRLRAAGARRLDAVLVTHAQADHLGAAADVLGALPVGAVLDGRDGVREPEGLRMAAAARAAGVRVLRPVAGEAVRDGPIALRVLWPPAGRPAPGADPNDRAVVARATVGRLSVLLTADAESDVLRRLDLGPVDVLKVSHHGSADPGLPALLARLRPRVAIVSVGARNPYGHPVPATLAALRAAGADVHRTDREGTVVVEPAGGGIRVHAGA